MQKRGMILVILILIVFISPTSAVIKLKEKEKGDIEEVTTQKYSGNITYAEVVEREIIGFKPVYVLNQTTYEECFSGNCNTITLTQWYIDKTLTGSPIYGTSYVKNIKYNNKIYKFKKKGCWVCGKNIACLSKKDGYSQNRGREFKCDENNYPILLEGESGWIENLETKEKIYSKSDVGIIT